MDTSNPYTAPQDLTVGNSTIHSIILATDALKLVADRRVTAKTHSRYRE